MNINRSYLSKILYYKIWPQNSSYQQKCDLLTKEPEIRLAEFLGNMGNLILGRFREGVRALKNED
jgi:hypothetical protein